MTKDKVTGLKKYLMPIILFVFGFILLLKGADILTDAASQVAKKLGVANFIVGVIVLGIGTSIPELVVTVFANLQSVSAVGLGAILGSNTFNTLFITGVAAIISPLILTKGEVFRHLPINIGSVLVVAALVAFSALTGGFFGLTRIAGIFLLILFFGWIAYLYFVNRFILEGESPVSTKERSGFLNALFIIGGLIGIILGGEWVTEGAVSLAGSLGLSKSVIGLTVVGLGTSLPELFTSAVAARKKNYGIAVGNIIGSNIFDFLMILGLAAAMKPIPFSAPLIVDTAITALSVIMLFASMFLGKKYVVKRWQGAIFIFFYFVYLSYLFWFR